MGMVFMKLKKCKNGFLVQINRLSGTFTVNSWSEALKIAWKLRGDRI